MRRAEVTPPGAVKQGVAATMQQVTATGGDKEVDMTAMAVEQGHVGCTRMADGLLVQLVGVGSGIIRWRGRELTAPHDF